MGMMSLLSGLSVLCSDSQSRVSGRRHLRYFERCVSMNASVVERTENSTVDDKIVAYFKNLQQGSDVRGVAMDGVLEIPQSLLLVNKIRPQTENFA